MCRHLVIQLYSYTYQRAFSLQRPFLCVHLVFILGGQESKEISKLHGRMSKDLVKAAEKASAAVSESAGGQKKGKSSACPHALALNAFSRYDVDKLGFLKVRSCETTL